MSTFSGRLTGEGTPLYQRTGAAADGRGQRALDAHVIFAEGFDSIVRQPAAELLEALLARKYFHPGDLPFSAIRFLDGGVEDADAGTPDIASGAVAFDERNDRIVGHDQLTAAT